MQSPVTIQYVGYATTVIRCGDLAVVTDPYYRTRLGIHRRKQEQPTLEGIEPTAFVLSNMGNGHLDLGAYKYATSRTPIILPPSTASDLHGFISNPLVEVAHWVPHTVVPGLTITPVPVRQFGARLHGLRGRYASAYLIQFHETTVYFAGTTNFGTHFREVGNMYEVDIALLPLQHWRQWYEPLHNSLSVSEFWQAAEELKAMHVLPLRWGTFGKSRVGPANIAELEVMRDVHPASQLHVLSPGGGAATLERSEAPDGNQLSS